MANGPGVRSWQVRDDLGKVMSVNLGLFRTKESMTEALAQIHVLKARAEQVFVQDRGKIFNSDLIQSLELGSLVEVADTIAASALAREESRGAHYRSDFPNRDDVRWLTHTLAHRAPDSPRLSYTLVTVTRFPPKWFALCQRARGKPLGRELLAGNHRVRPPRRFAGRRICR